MNKRSGTDLVWGKSSSFLARLCSSVRERLKVVAARRDSGVGSEETDVSAGTPTCAVFCVGLTPCTLKSGVRENSSCCKEMKQYGTNERMKSEGTLKKVHVTVYFKVQNL